MCVYVYVRLRSCVCMCMSGERGTAVCHGEMYVCAICRNILQTTSPQEWCEEGWVRPGIAFPDCPLTGTLPEGLFYSVGFSLQIHMKRWCCWSWWRDVFFIRIRRINDKTLIIWGQGPWWFYSSVYTASNTVLGMKSRPDKYLLNGRIINECNILYWLNQILSVNHCSSGSWRSWQLRLH